MPQMYDLSKLMPNVFPLDILMLVTYTLLILTQKNNGFCNCACQSKPQKLQNFELHPSSAFTIHTNASG